MLVLVSLFVLKTIPPRFFNHHIKLGYTHTRIDSTFMKSHIAFCTDIHKQFFVCVLKLLLNIYVCFSPVSIGWCWGSRLGVCFFENPSVKTDQIIKPFKTSVCSVIFLWTNGLGCTWLDILMLVILYCGDQTNSSIVHKTKENISYYGKKLWLISFCSC